MLLERVSIDKDVGFTLYSFGKGENCILIVAGMHGDEVCSVAISFELIERLKSSSIRGVVKIIPIVNEWSLKLKVHNNPIDGLDINRLFPGSIEGSVSERIANRVWKYVTECNYVLELHCDKNSIPYILTYRIEEDFIKDFVSKIPIEIIVVSNEVRGQLFIEAVANGVSAASIAFAGSIEYDLNDIHSYTNIILDTLANLGFIKRKEKIVSQKIYPKYLVIRADREGLLEVDKMPGNDVGEQEVIGRINGFEIRSPVSGKILMISKPTYVVVGQPIAKIAVSSSLP